MYIVLFIIGTFLNSFAVCFGSDWGQHNINVVRRSSCDYCKSVLQWYQLIPLLSQLLLNFRCNKCKQHISKRYFVFEILGGVSLVITYILLREFTLFQIILINLIFQLIFVIDFQFFWIPDILHLLLLIIIFPSASFFSIAYAFYLFCLLIILSFLLVDSLGGGDIKLITILSLSLSYQQIPNFLFFASITALIYYFICKHTDKSTRLIPFAPFIIIAYLISKGFF